MEMGRRGGVRGHACLGDHLKAGSEREEGAGCWGRLVWAAAKNPGREQGSDSEGPPFNALILRFLQVTPVGTLCPPSELQFRSV